MNELFTACYYFRAHMYTCVPRHIREDMKWMADHGAKAVVPAVLEQDLTAAVENLEVIAHEAERAGLRLHIVPSRWGGHVAGSPKVPSHFTVCRPSSWALDREGAPLMSSVAGPMTSIHHPDARELWETSLEALFAMAPVAALVLDEPKIFGPMDFSPAARASLGEAVDDPSAHLDAGCAFYGWICSKIKEYAPSCETVLFTYGDASAAIREGLAALLHLDTFGCDGRPWSVADGGESDTKVAHKNGSVEKALVDQGASFVETARRHGKKSIFLIENHALNDAECGLMEHRLDEIIGLGSDQIYYYYYPRSVKSPDLAMNILGQKMKAACASRHGPSLGESAQERKILAR